MVCNFVTLARKEKSVDCGVYCMIVGKCAALTFVLQRETFCVVKCSLCLCEV